MIKDLYTIFITASGLLFMICLISAPIILNRYIKLCDKDHHETNR